AFYELVSIINQRLWMGHFEVWDDGEIVFRHAMTLMTGEQPSLAQAAGMIDVAVEAADRFYPAFDFMVRGARSAAEAMAACMFETVGEACRLATAAGTSRCSRPVPADLLGSAAIVCGANHP